MSGTAEQIAMVIGGRLAQVTIVNGFETDVGTRVYRGRRRIDPDQLPCVVMFEADDKVLDSNAAGSVKLMQRYVIEAHDNCDADHPNDKAHMLLRDMKRAVFGSDRTLGGQARDVHYAGRGIAARDDGLTVVSAVIQIDVEFVENLRSP